MSDIGRRRFLHGSAFLLGGMLAGFPVADSTAQAAKRRDEARSGGNGADDSPLNLSVMPNFCSHEHWGSIGSIGLAPGEGGWRCDTTAGAQPLAPTTIWDLVLEPYQEWWMEADESYASKAARGGASHYSYSHAYNELWKSSPGEALRQFKERNLPLAMTGGFQCTRRGILFLYGIDLGEFRLQDWKNADAGIRENYNDVFAWYARAMRKAHFTELIRPVHPEFYVQQESSASKAKEAALTHTIMRIDPLMGLWKENSLRRNALAKIARIEPADAGSWREFITRIFDLAAENHTVGIKQLQAYSRRLLFEPRTDQEVAFRGNLDASGVVKFQDWVMHECCKQAHERNWVHQVHVGTNNITESSPMPLEPLAERYPKMNIVMLHCWPFLKEAGWLAKFVPNIYIDTCWMPVLDPEFLREGLQMWLNYVPTHKIMLAHDSTHIEMAAGSSLFTREILGESLLSQQRRLKMSRASLRTYAAGMLQNNAVQLYNIGQEAVVERGARLGSSRVAGALRLTSALGRLGR